jgi:hypothetical protein
LSLRRKSVKSDFLERMGELYWAGVGAGLVFFLAALMVAVKGGFGSGPVNLMLCFFGAAAGWFVGIIISPQTPGQTTAFVGYGRAMTAFLSGYVLAKADRIWAVIAPHQLNSAQIESLTLQALLFGTCFAIGTLTTFAGRNFGTPMAAEIPEASGG